MPTIRIHQDLQADLIILCGQIQIIKNERTSPSTAISLLLKFAKERQGQFDAFIIAEREKRFSTSYAEKIARLRRAGIPTTQDLKV